MQLMMVLDVTKFDEGKKLCVHMHVGVNIQNILLWQEEETHLLGANCGIAHFFASIAIVAIIP
jgi:hypothetical protein